MKRFFFFIDTTAMVRFVLFYVRCMTVFRLVSFNLSLMEIKKIDSISSS